MPSTRCRLPALRRSRSSKAALSLRPIDGIISFHTDGCILDETYFIPCALLLFGLAANALPVRPALSALRNPATPFLPFTAFSDAIIATAHLLLLAVHNSSDVLCLLVVLLAKDVRPSMRFSRARVLFKRNEAQERDNVRCPPCTCRRTEVKRRALRCRGQARLGRIVQVQER